MDTDASSGWLVRERIAPWPVGACVGSCIVDMTVTTFVGASTIPRQRHFAGESIMNIGSPPAATGARHAHLDALNARLEVSAASDGRPAAESGISVERLRRWITGVRQGTLCPEEATLAESDLGALEREADQGGI